MKITIAKIGDDKTVNFAIEELYKYLKIIDSDSIVEICSYKSYNPSLENVIWVGMDDSFTNEMPAVKDSRLDDAILIDVKDTSGKISGNNPRSVLIAVYRFLKELGCVWVRNTADGEIIPQYPLSPISVYINEAASYRHRAICIEGSVTCEHIIDTIDWIPKAAMNGYYIQFFLPVVFFQRWYDHSTNRFLPPEPYTRERIQGFINRIEEEISKRGLLYHAIGHGWTSEPLGFESSSWDKTDGSEITDDKRILLAEINGKRDFKNNMPMGTNLCYSNPIARKTVTDAVVSYCLEHPNIDYLHFWLADCSNSFCECEGCRDTIPADHYVMMLNEIDERLTNAGNDTKIVFLAYGDLLWAPENEKLKNTDRFTLMFAPITRKYSQSFKNTDLSSGEVAPYLRNKISLPTSVAENVAHLRNWLERSGATDSFDFDYHLMWDHQKDIGYYGIAKVLFDDMQNLDRVGLNGMVSCQLTRASFPTGLPMQMMAEALWDKECDFEEKSDEYFLSAFGSDGLSVKNYLKTLSDLVDFEYIKYFDATWDEEDQKRKFLAAQGLVSEFEKVIKTNLDSIDGNTRKSWEYLKMHSEFLKLFIPSLIRRSEGASAEELARLCNGVTDFIAQNDSRLHRTLDTFYYHHMVIPAIKKEY
ncbi:MAG: DUF4838 domain-containing protein [Clostridia bacterium]|nr:DUF4838 domain-containing protein [Clostridia bacterium]